MKDYLAVDDVIPVVQMRVEEILRVLSAGQSRLKRAPEGNLGGSMCHSSWQWYKTLGRRGTKTYLSNQKKSLIRALAQKKYDLRLVEELLRQLGVLDRFLQDYTPNRINEIFEGFKEVWRPHIQPVTASDDEYASAWMSVGFRGKPFAADAPAFIASNGTRVRSKSEFIIMEELIKQGVPFRYEYPYEMTWRSGASRKNESASRKVTVYPDFTCLNRRTRREFIWEHFGMMDDSDYANGTLEKIENYERNGFFVGENMIVSAETELKPLNPKRVRNLISKYF